MFAVLTSKAFCEYVIRAILALVANWRQTDTILKSDGELSCKSTDGRFGIARSAGIVASHGNHLGFTIKAATTVQLGPSHPILALAVRHAAWLHPRFLVKCSDTAVHCALYGRGLSVKRWLECANQLWPNSQTCVERTDWNAREPQARRGSVQSRASRSRRVPARVQDHRRLS